VIEMLFIDIANDIINNITKLRAINNAKEEFFNHK
jgi:hypothetical protein